jgi:hypothetical protein
LNTLIEECLFEVVCKPYALLYLREIPLKCLLDKGYFSKAILNALETRNISNAIEKLVFIVPQSSVSGKALISILEIERRLSVPEPL